MRSENEVKEHIDKSMDRNGVAHWAFRSISKTLPEVRSND